MAAFVTTDVGFAAFAFLFFTPSGVTSTIAH